MREMRHYLVASSQLRVLRLFLLRPISMFFSLMVKDVIRQATFRPLSIGDEILCN